MDIGYRAVMEFLKKYENKAITIETTMRRNNEDGNIIHKS